MFTVAFIETTLVRIFPPMQTDNLNSIKSSSSTPHEQWQNNRAEVQIRVLLNIARTNMIASGLTKFWMIVFIFSSIFVFFSNSCVFLGLKP